MTHSPNAKQSSKSKYVSCIKINGVPILPPLITSEKRKEIRRLKRAAVKVEKRLEREKELAEYVSELYNTCTTELTGNDQRNLSNLINHETQTSSLYDNLNVTTNTSMLHLSPTKPNQENTLAAKPINRNLSLNIQAAQYISNEAEVFTLAQSNLHAEESQENGDLVNKTSQQSVSTKTPKLIRSNSYTLDAPSPALAKYLKEQNSANNNIPKLTICWDVNANSPNKIDSSTRLEVKDDCDNQSELLQTNQICLVASSQDAVNKTIEELDTTLLNKNDLEITSVEATPRNLKKPDCVLTLSDKFNELNAFDDCYDTSRTETELKNLSDCDTESHLPISEGLQEFITNNVPVSSANYDYDDISVSQVSENTANESTSSDWNSILKKIPSAYSRQILELLEQQQFDNTYSLVDSFDDIHLNPEQYSTPHETSTNTQTDETIYYSALKLPQEEKESSTVDAGTLYEDVQDTLSPLPGEKDLRAELKSWKEEIKVLPQIIPKSSVSNGQLSREQAATKINAAARGFLVRRLMKTETVQHLIQTINEAVLCAVQLHRDTLDHIEEADVELHRRLIQQVSAACYSFHNVFFATSIHDKMSYIHVDRQKKIEKLRRISSANSSASSKSNNSTRKGLNLSRNSRNSHGLHR